MNTMTVSIVLTTNMSVEEVTQWAGEAISNPEIRNRDTVITARSVVVEMDETSEVM